MSVPKGTVFKRREPTTKIVDMQQIPRNDADLDRYIQAVRHVKSRELFSIILNLIHFQQQVREGEIRNKHRIRVADEWYEALKLEVDSRF